MSNSKIATRTFTRTRTPCASLSSSLLILSLAACGGAGEPASSNAQSSAQSSAQNNTLLAVSSSGSKRTLAAAPAATGGVMINEVNAGNWKGALDEDGDAEDWVELYNPASTPVDLSGYGLSNKSTTPFYWTFPAGTQIAARGHLTVWLSKKDRALAGRPLHSNFNLDHGADSVYLTASNATVLGIRVDSATPPLARADQTWCRIPSGVATAPFAVCDQPTFNSANSGTGYGGILAKPTLSLKSGFYAGAQSVTITGPAGATLRYTTDGSEPTVASAAYTAALGIDASTVLRVAAFAAAAATSSAPSLVETATYVINAAQASQYLNLKAVMVTLSPADLAQFQANNQGLSFRASFELITGGSTSVFKIDAEGKAGGNAGSADSPVRVMNVAARDAFGFKSFPAANLWADKPGLTSVKKFRLRNGSNDWDQAHLRDQLSQRISAAGPNLVAASSAVAMFINGRYYALMDLREREDETLPSSNLGLDKDYVDFLSDPLLDGQEIKNGGAAALDNYTVMSNFITGNDMAIAANYARAKTLMNPDTLAYDWALHMFHANYDWPYHNVHAWRSPELDNRWNWRAHDMDWAFGLYTSVNYNMNASYTAPGSSIFSALMKNAEFRTLYLNTVADQMNVMSPAYMAANLAVLANDMRPYIADNHAAVGLGTAAVWEARVTEIRRYFDQREPIYDGHNRSQFGLAERQPISVAVNDVGMGSVTVNSVDTSKFTTIANPTWAGRYYPGVPITLEAKPRPGFAFAGWQGASTSSARRITQTLTAGATSVTNLTAVFAATSAPAAPVLAAFAAPSFRTGDSVRLQLSATDPGGYPITYSASNLPKGVALNASSGALVGRLTTPGVFASTLRATNGVSSGTLAVTWTVLDRVGTGLLGTSPDSGPPVGPPPPPPNVAPSAVLTAPLSNAQFTVGAAIAVSANASDTDGSVVRVEFFDGSSLIGSATTAPYAISWTGATLGSHSLTARAIDNAGASSVSAASLINVVAVVPPPPPPSNTGTGLLGQYFNNLAQEGAPVLTRVEAVNFNWGTGSPSGAVAKDFFSARWTGLVQAHASGAHQFQTTSDDGVRVTVNGQVVIDNLTPHGPTVDTSAAVNLVAGQRYSIVVQYQEYSGGAQVQLRWKTPTDNAFVVLPTSRLYTAAAAGGSGTGLAGRYYAGLFFEGAALLSRTEAVNFDWGNGSPGGSVPADFFSARWTGYVEAGSSGAYQFQTNSDDGVRVYVGGQLVINNFTPHGPTLDTSAVLNLVAGQRYSIVVEYQEYSGGALLQLRWKPPGDTAYSAVPASRLYTAP